MVYIISIENIQARGKLIITVYFNGYKDSYQNDARRKLINIPKMNEIKDLDINLTPLEFSIIRMESDLIKRGIGVAYQYKFRNMTPEKFKNLSDFIHNISKSLNWWGRESIILNIENIPLNGILIFTIYFSDYKDYSKKKVKKETENLVPEILNLERDEKLDINLRLTEFGIVRMILGGVSRIVGVSYRFKFNDMNENKYNSLIKLLKTKKNLYDWWDSELFITADYMEV